MDDNEFCPHCKRKYTKYTDINDMLEKERKKERCLEICRGKGINPALLEGMFQYMGLEDTVMIARKLQIHVSTVDRYLRSLNQLTESDYKLLREMYGKEGQTRY